MLDSWWSSRGLKMLLYSSKTRRWSAWQLAETRWYNKIAPVLFWTLFSRRRRRSASPFDDHFKLWLCRLQCMQEPSPPDLPPKTKSTMLEYEVRWHNQILQVKTSPESWFSIIEQRAEVVFSCIDSPQREIWSVSGETKSDGTIQQQPHFSVMSSSTSIYSMGTWAVRAEYPGGRASD